MKRLPLQATDSQKTPFYPIMPMRHSILKVLAYFDLFDYPVTIDEVRFFLDKDVPFNDLKTELESLLTEGMVFMHETFYSLRNEPRLATRRIKGNKHANELLKIAARISRQLYRFPYVRGVGISGSLSKNFADEEADIDYFIITRRNRLWIARTLMHLYKKISYLRNRQNWYCMNYYVDEEALEIKEKNIFTATEMITLMPASGNGGLTSFFDANSWTTHYFPHYRTRKKEADGPLPVSIVKTIFEKLLDNRWGDRLDDLLQRWTSTRWQKKEERGDRNSKGTPMSLQNTKHYSRPNPGNFQQHILQRYANRINELGISEEK